MLYSSSRRTLGYEIIRARAHTVCEDPIVIVKIIFPKVNRVFEAPNVLQKLRNFASTSQVAKNFVFKKKWKGAWPNGATAPPTKLRASSPTIRFHLHVRKTVHTCIIRGWHYKWPGGPDALLNMPGPAEWPNHLPCGASENNALKIELKHLIISHNSPVLLCVLLTFLWNKRVNYH